MYRPFSLVLTLVALSAGNIPAAHAQEPVATLAVTSQMPLLNGEVHQARIRCMACSGRCPSDPMQAVAAGELIVNHGGLGNHTAPNRIDEVPLVLHRGQRIEDATQYRCDLALRHPSTGVGVFLPPVEASAVTSGTVWRAARCGTPFVPEIEGALPQGFWKQSLTRVGALQMTGIPRDDADGI